MATSILTGEPQLPTEIPVPALQSATYAYDPAKGGAGGDGSRFVHPRSVAEWGIWCGLS
jgi:hypothetical protein